MSAREQARQRDRAARARLADDPVFQIKQARPSEHVQQRPDALRDPDRPLTPAELTALRLSSHGLTEPMVAEAMGKSRATVKTRYLRNARAKLQAKDTTHAVANAIRWGLIP